MHRSSESIASLAAALAKAQMVLTNPEKSLTGTVPSNRYDEPGRTFRYAPLSSGLDIVRKALGEQEIATLQTTTIDQDIQSVSLTTVLAHSSGEWIASDWPVCALSDLATPRRMGAALTYARRYALFTLVGIAGEDDLDAPDLGGQPAEASRKAGNGLGNGRPTGSGGDQPLGSFAQSRKPWSPPKQLLDPDKSAALRDRLLNELEGITDPDGATAWAQRSLVAKNTLTGSDAARVEAEFASRTALMPGTGSTETCPPTDDAGSRGALTPSEQTEPQGRAALMAALRASVELGPAAAEATAAPPRAHESVLCGEQGVKNAVSRHIDKGALALSEPRRYRDRAHLKFVSAQPCLICGRRPSDAHHLRFAQPRALGRRVSDEYTVPLCRTHHRTLHRYGDEAAWWVANKVDAVVVARELWQRTRLDGPGDGRVAALRSVGVIESPGEARTGLAQVGCDQRAQAPGSTGQ
jgi:ERF superfamily protein